MKKFVLGALLAIGQLSSMAFGLELKDMKSWGYQLHNYAEKDFTRMKNSKNTLWVIDYSKDGSDALKFSKEEIAAIKKNGNMVIAYFCLGEAEMTRYYWSSFNRESLISADDAKTLGYKPEFLKFTTVDGRQILGRNNAEYVDNFPVKFWLPSWQKMMTETTSEFGASYLERIMNAGFDGVYLDTIDAFEYYNDKVIAARAKEMYKFVMKISKEAKSKNPQFKIMLQNAMSITDHLSDEEQNSLFSVVKGFGVEDLFYPGEGENNRRSFSKFGEYKQIQAIKKKYKDVAFFTVDYIPGLGDAEINDYFKDARKKDLVPVVADRALAGTLFLAK